jgi:5-methylcytosine-specific restriction protein A
MQKQRLTRPWMPQQTRATKMETRERSADEYHTARWTRESREFRRANPLCRRCESKGVIKSSEVTDHIVPPEVYGNFWDRKYWQALCKRCNIEKGNEDKKLIQQFRNENR